MRRLLVAFCALLLRIFFRRIEVVGEHHVPEGGAVIFAANHPNGLLDPLLLLCSTRRRVSFLAKAPLFRTPLIGYFVRHLESLPVYRSQDGADPAKNRVVLQRAVQLLERGNTLGLFPEGVSHSSPELARFKSGAARMALSAQALGNAPVHVVPVFLYYEQKQTFRSRAVVAYGPPLFVPSVSLDEAGEAPREAVNELTTRLRSALGAIAPTALTVDALVLAEKAERLLDVDRLGPDHPRPTLAERMSRRRHLLDLYPVLAASHPEDVTRVIRRLEELSSAFERRGLPLDVHAPGAATSRSAWPRRLSTLLLLAGPGSCGVVLHAPAYQLVKYLAVRYSGQETDVEATAKLVGGLLLFPATWLAAAAGVAFLVGPVGFALALALGPVLGGAALGLLETAGWMARHRGRSAFDARADVATLVQQRRLLASNIRSLLMQAPSGEASALSPSRGL